VLTILLPVHLYGVYTCDFSHFFAASEPITLPQKPLDQAQPDEKYPLIR
jgi:hypothetical protein